MFACLKQDFASSNCAVGFERKIFMSEVEDEEVLLEVRYLTRGVGSASGREFGRETDNFASAMMACQAR